MADTTTIPAIVRRAVERTAACVVGVDRGGSGVVIAPGLVATNAHNIRREEVAVTFPDGRRAPATVRAADLDGDLAVLAVETGDTPAVTWAETPPALGDVVVALADPAGRGLRATVGTISSVGRAFRGPRGRRIPGGLEHTAPLARGSSGGPVIDAEGAVIGLNTHRLRDGFYLAQPVTEALRDRLERLGRGEIPRRRRLGVALAPSPAARKLREAAGLEPVDGLLVRAVDDDGPGGRAGLRRGDVLVEADGRTIAAIDDLHGALDEAGATLALTVVRGSERTSVTVSFDDAGEAGKAGGGAPPVA